MSAALLLWGRPLQTPGTWHDGAESSVSVTSALHVQMGWNEWLFFLREISQRIWACESVRE